jgi:uroporphyrinogen-III synthase
MRVLLTQALPRAEALAHRVARKGHEPLILPFLQIRSLAGEPEAAEALARLDGYDVVVLVSPGAIEVALDAIDGVWPSGVKLAVIGPASLETLRERGLSENGLGIVRPPHPPYDVDGLLATPPFDRPGALRVLALVGARARTPWVNVLRARGADVHVIRLYDVDPCTPGPQASATLRAWAQESSPVVACFVSSDAVERCTQWADTLSLGDWLRLQRTLTIHPRIAATLSEHGWTNVCLIEPGEAPLFAALESSG